MTDLSIIDRLNSGALHTAARKRNPDCVDATGGIHHTPERARFVDWAREMTSTNGDDVRSWPAAARAEYDARYVPAR